MFSWIFETSQRSLQGWRKDGSDFLSWKYCHYPILAPTHGMSQFTSIRRYQLLRKDFCLSQDQAWTNFYHKDLSIDALCSFSLDMPLKQEYRIRSRSRTFWKARSVSTINSLRSTKLVLWTVEEKTTYIWRICILCSYIRGTLLKSCWSITPTKRPSAGEIGKHLG